MSNVLKFGKYKGKTVEEVAKDSRGMGWLRWALDKNMFDVNHPTFGEHNAKYVAEIKKVLGGSAEATIDVDTGAPTPKLLNNNVENLLLQILAKVSLIEKQVCIEPLDALTAREPGMEG